MALSVQQMADGGYFMVGYTISFGAGSEDFYIVKTDNFGYNLWGYTYGGSHSDIAYSVCKTTDEDYIVAGVTSSFGAGGRDFYLVKTNSQGDTLWTRTYGGSDDDEAYSVQQTADGGYILAGHTRSFGTGGKDFYLVKTGPEESEAEPVINSVPSQYTLYPNYPNPFNPSTQITYSIPKSGNVSLKVFNLLGQEVASLVNETQPAGTHVVSFDGSTLSSGIYFCQLRAGGFRQTQKTVLLK
jgi:hypothetical protein